MEAGRATRYVRKHPLPSVGDRFEELTVVGHDTAGKFNRPVVVVQCSCGAIPHNVYDYNLRNGKSTRCNACAKKKAGHWRKNYWAYADVVPSDDHRRRLLGRISACVNRCHNPKDGGYKNYGGRGIHVYEPWREDRRAFLAYIVTLENWDIASYELDREDVNKGYEPGNLRFITRTENAQNRRKIGTMQKTIMRLEAENRDLRHRLLRAEELLLDSL